MIIGFDIVGARHREMGGVEVYFENLLAHIQEIDLVNEYRVFADEYMFPFVEIHSDNFRKILFKNKRGSLNRFVRSAVKKIGGIDILDNEISRFRIDVLHYPFNTMRETKAKCKIVLTLHDIQHEYLPNMFAPVELERRRAYYERSVRRADRIITISHFSKHTIIEKYGVEPEKIEVIYIDASPNFTQFVEEGDSGECVKETFGLYDPFIFYPAALWPHKNHKTLLLAMKTLKEDKNFDGIIVFCGIKKGRNLEELDKMVERLSLRGSIKYLGFVRTEQLPLLYKSAKMLVFPSLFEGFGIPLVEAMRSGCPIACSNVTSIPEVVGDAAVMFDPNSEVDMAEKIWSLWESEEKREELRERGFRRARVFNWKRAAHETMLCYEKAIES